MTTIWILADQLSLDNSAFTTVDRAGSVVLFVESKAHGPDAAGAGYIHKMSNDCEGCRYSPLK